MLFFDVVLKPLHVVPIKDVVRQAADEALALVLLVFRNLLVPQLRKRVDNDTEDQVHRNDRNRDKEQQVKNDPANVVAVAWVPFRVARQHYLPGAGAGGHAVHQHGGKALPKGVAVLALIGVKVHPEEQETKD